MIKAQGPEGFLWIVIINILSTSPSATFAHDSMPESPSDILAKVNGGELAREIQTESDLAVHSNLRNQRILG